MRHPLFSPDSGGSSGSMANPSSQIRPAAAPSIGVAPPPRPIVPREDAAEPPPPKIQAFEQKMGVRKHEDTWKRSPNLTGTGAIHMKSFHCKMSDDSLTYLDQQINEWLDAHPQYEVKFVTTAVGEWTGKIKEPQMVVQVWV